MRRLMLFAVPLILLSGLSLVPASVAGQTKPAPKTKNPKKAAQQRPARPSSAGRYLVPGVGGVLPPRKTQPLPNFGPGGFGVLPKLPSQGPAQVIVPGQNGGLPGLTGVSGLAVRPVSRMLYGVNPVWGDNGGTANWDKDGGAKARRLAQLIKGLGATNVRIGISWAEVEKVHGKPDWRQTDRFVGYVSRLGVTPICVVGVTPDWALDRSPAALKLFRDRGVPNLAAVRAPEPKYYADLGRFAFALANRYRGKIAHWELWNEPDAMGMPFVVKDARGAPGDIRYGGDPKVYADLIRVFSTNVKRADPAARVAVGGLQTPKTDFLTGLYAAGARPFFDAIALHPYNGPNPLAFDWIDRCRNLVVQQGDTAKPFWITEWGWNTRPGARDAITDLHQARLVRESLAAMRERPFITQASYHTLNDWRTNERDPASLIAMGLVTYDLRAKPAYFAFREMATGAPSELARAYHRVNLIGALPTVDESGVRGSAINVIVDANKPGDLLPPLWEGFSQGREGGGTGFFEPAIPRLKALHARLVRFDPFPNPDAVKADKETRRQGDKETSTVSLSPGPRVSLSDVDWQYADSMIEAISQAGAAPMLDFATMPTALSASTGNAQMPRDLEEWAGFVRAVVRRYNVEQKRGIRYWELGNEPNSGAFALADWLRLYETFARSVTSADPSARVGGPSASAFGIDWLKALADYCARNHIPLHFLSWHAYGQPPDEYARQVEEIRDHLRRQSALKDVELFVDEWNASARPSPENDGVYGAAYAASVVEKLIGAAPVRSLFYEVKEGANFRQPGARLSGRWGLLTSDNQPKAVYNAFEMLSRTGGARVPAASEETGIHALASRTKDRVSVLVWSYAPPRPSSETGPPPLDVPVRLRVRGLPWTAATAGRRWLVDPLHGNANANLASSELPQVASFTAPAGDLEIPIVLSANGLTLVELTPAPARSLEVTADTPRFVVYAGSPFTITATVKNVSGRPQTIGAALLDTDSRAPHAVARSKASVLKPGETRRYAYAVSAPVGNEEGQHFYGVSAAGVTAGIGVRVVSPIVARLERDRADVARPGAPLDSAASTARVRAILENRADLPLRVSLQSGKSSESVTVPGHSVIAAPVSVTTPSALPGNYPAEVKALYQGGVIATLNPIVGVPALCRYAVRKPRINGDLTEWTDAYALTIDSASQMKEKHWGGARDLSAQVYTMWDEQNLYVAATVEDDAHVQPYTGGDIVRADSLQFGIDALRDAAFDQQGYTRTDYEFALALTASGPQIYRLYGPIGPSGLIPGAQVVIRRVGTRTIYEAAIPWSQLAPAKPKNGSILGFAARVNDNDGQATGYGEWGSGLETVRHPGRFLGLRLVK